MFDHKITAYFRYCTKILAYLETCVLRPFNVDISTPSCSFSSAVFFSSFNRIKCFVAFLRSSCRNFDTNKCPKDIKPSS